MKYHPRPPRHRTYRPDPVTPETRAAVIARDGGMCVAPRLDPASGPCRGRWGGPVSGSSDLTVDHVQEDYGRMGKRAESIPERLATVCWGHHVHSHWATSNRPLLRIYLESVMAAGPHGEL